MKSAYCYSHCCAYTATVVTTSGTRYRCIRTVGLVCTLALLLFIFTTSPTVHVAPTNTGLLSVRLSEFYEQRLCQVHTDCPYHVPFCLTASTDTDKQQSQGPNQGSEHHGVCVPTTSGRCVWIDGFVTCTRCINATCTVAQPRNRCGKIHRQATERAVYHKRRLTDGALGLQTQAQLALSEEIRTSHFLPSCDMGLVPPCFDTRKCDATSMSLYIHGAHNDSNTNTYKQWILSFGENARKNTTINISLASSPDNACLRVVHISSFETQTRMTSAQSWNGGTNTFVMLPNHWLSKGAHGDDPFSNWEFGMASLGSTSLVRGVFRPHYDMVMPLRANLAWPRWTNALRRNMNRDRRWLVGFRGAVENYTTSWQQHRWIAGELLHSPEQGVIMNTRCPYSNVSYDEAFPYLEVLLNSTFAFVPGGAGMHSYRAIEALQAGAIPVITDDVLLPFQPEVHWNACAVTIPETDLIEMPNILKRIATHEVKERLKACKQLLDAVYDTVDADFESARDRGSFKFAMMLWAKRLRFLSTLTH